MCFLKGTSKQIAPDSWPLANWTTPSSLFFSSTTHYLCWNIKIPSISMWCLCQRQRRRKEGKLHVRNKCLDIGQHLPGIRTKLYVICRHSAVLSGGGKSQVMNTGQLGIFFGSRPTLPDIGRWKSSQAFTLAEGSIWLKILMQCYSGSWPQLFWKKERKFQNSSSYISQSWREFHVTKPTL